MQYKFMITPMLVVFPILLIMGGWCLTWHSGSEEREPW